MRIHLSVIKGKYADMSEGLCFAFLDVLIYDASAIDGKARDRELEGRGHSSALCI